MESEFSKDGGRGGEGKGRERRKEGRVKSDGERRCGEEEGLGNGWEGKRRKWEGLKRRAWVAHWLSRVPVYLSSRGLEEAL